VRSVTSHDKFKEIKKQCFIPLPRLKQKTKRKYLISWILQVFSHTIQMSSKIQAHGTVHFVVLTPSGLKNLFAMSSEKPNVGASPTAAGS